VDGSGKSAGVESGGGGVTHYIQCLLRTQMGLSGQDTTWKTKFKSLGGTWGMLLLFCVVMGGIYFGVFTPTEAAGFGAFGAFLFALFRRKLNVRSLIQCLLDTGKTTAMIFFIIIGANIFSTFLGIAQIPMGLADFITGLALPKTVVLAGIIFIYIILGCIMDCYAIMILTVPIIFPVIQAMQFDPIWFGVLMVIIILIADNSSFVGDMTNGDERLMPESFRFSKNKLPNIWSNALLNKDRL
jgi:TRAP-type C4-dicarboxylate transport system permease large subunit